MNIYIPKHIRNIGVVGKMCDLIEAYNNSGMYVDDTGNSFEDYYYYLKTDPIIKFLHFCISKDDWQNNHPNEEYESVILYISRLFYSVEGTCKVFDFMKKYLGFEITDIKYTVKTLSFRIKSIKLVDIDENVFYNSLLEFLNTLLYFNDLDIKIDNIDLWLSNTLRNYIGENTTTYKEYTTVRYGEN